MKYFVYAMNGKDPAPAAGGLTEGWFFYYKWDVDGEAFVPFPRKALSPDITVEPGDLLWFIMDGRPLGCVPILRADEDHMQQDVLELHYDTRKMQAAPIENMIRGCEQMTTGLAENDTFKRLVELKQLFDVNYPPRTPG